MTKEDKQIWQLLIRRHGKVMQILFSYLTGQYWLTQATGLLATGHVPTTANEGLGVEEGSRP